MAYNRRPFQVKLYVTSGTNQKDVAFGNVAYPGSFQIKTPLSNKNANEQMCANPTRTSTMTLPNHPTRNQLSLLVHCCVCIVYRLNRSSQWTIHTQHCATRRKGKRHGPNCWPCFAMANGDPVKRNLERNESAPRRIKKTIKASCHCVGGRF